MSVATSILEELFFAAAELQPVDSLDQARLVDTKWEVPVAGSSRRFQTQVPFFVRELSALHLAAAWPVFCGLLRKHGIPLFSSIAALEQVPAAAVPSRWGRRYLNEPFEVDEVKSADAFEIACCDRQRQVWGWSSEAPPGQLAGMLHALRLAGGGDTPVGMALPLSCRTSDFKACIEAGADFITLVALSARLGPDDIHALADKRRMCQAEQRPHLPLLLVAPLIDAGQAIKLLALGASAVCLDSLLLPLIPKTAVTKPTASAGAGMLSGIAAPPPRKPQSLPDMERGLIQLVQELEGRMRSVGAARLAQLDSQCLRACTERCQHITGAASLSSQP